MRSREERATARFEAAGPDDRYVVTVDRGRLEIDRATENFNAIARLGWRLHTAIEQSGNTLMIWERAVLPARPSGILRDDVPPG